MKKLFCLLLLPAAFAALGAQGASAGDDAGAGATDPADAGVCLLLVPADDVSADPPSAWPTLDAAERHEAVFQRVALEQPAAQALVACMRPADDAPRERT